MTGVRHAAAPQRWAGGVALALVLAALAWPAGTIAGWLGGTHPADIDSVRLGNQLLRVALLVVAGAVALGPTLRARVTYPAPSGAATAAVTPREAWSLAALVASAGILRVIHLEAGLWLDEINTLTDYVRLPWTAIVSTYQSQNNHPLYSLLARGSWLAAGQADWAIRIPAVAFGVASLWATWLVLRAFATAREAWLTTSLLAVSYHHVWFSQNARGYTALMLFSVLGTGVLHRVLTGTSRAPLRDAWLYAVILALAVYTHLTAALIAVGHLAAVVVPQPGVPREVANGRRGYALVSLVLAALLSVAMYAMVLPQVAKVVLTPTMHGVEVEWTRLDWMLGEAFRAMAGAIPGGAFLVVAAGVVVAVGVVNLWSERPVRVALMLGPVAVTLVGILALRHNLWPRFFFFAAPFLVLPAFRGGFTIARRLGAIGERLATAGAVLVVVASATTVPRAWGPKQDFPAATRLVEEARRPSDGIATLDISAVLEEQYLEIPGAERVGTLEDLRALEARHPRTIVLYTFPVRLRAIAPLVMARLESAAYREVGRIPATVGGGEIRIVIHEQDRPEA